MIFGTIYNPSFVSLLTGFVSENGQKYDNYQHVADRLRSNGCVATDDNVEGCCWAADKHLSLSHYSVVDRVKSNDCVAMDDNTKVVANRQTYLTPQSTSAQQTDSGLIAVLQRMTIPRVVARPQADTSPISKSACLCRQNTLRLGGNTNYKPERREVRMIFGGPRDVRNGRWGRDKYSQKGNKPHQIVVHTTGSKPPIGYAPQPDDIIFTQADASWVHDPYEDALVITAEVVNNLIHQLLVDSGSTVNTLYWCAYQKIGLRRADLTSITSPPYRFTSDSVIPERTIKLAVTLGEPPQAAIVVIDFLTVKCPSSFNGVLGRPLIKALKAVTPIHCLTIKFPIEAGIGKVRER